MLDVKWLRENREEAERRLVTRGEEAPLGAFEELDGKRRKLLREVEELKELRNRVSEEIGTMKKEGKDASPKIKGMREVGDRIKEMEKGLRAHLLTSGMTRAEFDAQLQQRMNKTLKDFCAEKIASAQFRRSKLHRLLFAQRFPEAMA